MCNEQVFLHFPSGTLDVVRMFLTDGYMLEEIVRENYESLSPLLDKIESTLDDQIKT